MERSKTGRARPDPQLPTRRLEALIDGVFAIAITLLAIEVSVPIVESARSSDLIDALARQWPSYVAYTVTFFVVGAYWINHHRMFFLLRGIDHTFLILNIFCLMAIAIIPFPNAVLAEYLSDAALRGVASGLYGLAMAILAIVFNIVWRYAHRRGLFRQDVDRDLIQRVLNTYSIGPVAYLIGVALSWLAPIAALILYLLLPLGYLFEGPVGAIREGYLGEEA